MEAARPEWDPHSALSRSNELSVLERLMETLLALLQGHSSSARPAPPA